MPTHTRPTAIITSCAARRTSLLLPPNPSPQSCRRKVWVQGLPWRLFYPPPPRPLFPIWRLFPGCFARPLSSIWTPRLKPTFALQPPSCDPLLAPTTAVSIQAAPSPVAFQPPFNLKAAPSLPGPWGAAPRHSRAGKKTRSTIQYNSNPPPRPNAPRPCPELVEGFGCRARPACGTVPPRSPNPLEVCHVQPHHP